MTDLELFVTGDASYGLFGGVGIWVHVGVLLSLTLAHCIVNLGVISLMVISLPSTPIGRLHFPLLSLLVKVHDLAVVRYGQAFKSGCSHFLDFKNRGALLTSLLVTR